MAANLNLLADKLGIARHFSDAGLCKRTYEVEDGTIRFFCRCFGFDANDEDRAAASLARLEDLRWKTPLENIVILRGNKHCLEMILHDDQQVDQVKICFEDGTENQVDFTVSETGERKKHGRRIYRKVQIVLKNILPYGYYKAAVTVSGEVYRTVLAAVPNQCYTTKEVESAKLWGYSLQLYSLKSRHNWGVGDFTDLKNFAALCQRSGADIIGLNPLNVLFHDFPENASPYSSISRLFLNPIYIDVTAVPGFDQTMAEKYQLRVEDAKKGDLIDYTKVYNLKIEVLGELFKQRQKQKNYMAAFEQFKAEKGLDLERLAVYQAIYHEQSAKVWGGWPAWPKELQDPSSYAVAQFQKAHAEEIEFFKYLQFEADRQLKDVYAEVWRLGLKVGLYRDLPVGVCKDSAELWADKYVFINQAGAGAPPDAFFPCGQKWCLGAFNPYELKKSAYEPYLKILRANMAYAGALRIDHVMGLMRLFMIPDDKQSGTYIHYNFDDMLGLLALESYRHRCVIVGESIGNVPDGFLDKLRSYHIYSLSVLWSERWDGGAGDFKMPRDYPEDAFVSVGTHDMPPLKMWWFGYEIELNRSLGMLDDAGRIEAYKRREADRFKLLAALDFNRVWPADRHRLGDYLYGEGYPQGMDEAVHKLVSQTPCKVVMLQPEDMLGVDKLQNLPGTDRDKYPNWRRRLPVDLEDMEKEESFCRNVAAVRSARRSE